MHLHRKALRNVVCAAALVTLALPLATPIATPANAQTGQPSSLPTSCTPSTAASGAAATTSTTCYVAATPPVAFNPIGAEHTVTFICDALVSGLVGAGGTAPGTVPGPTIPPGCYDVQATVTDITTGSPATVVSATCGNVAAGVTGGAVDCSGVASPICPVGSAPAPAPGPTTPCVASAAAAGFTNENTVKVTINPGAPHAYRVTFTGYVPTTAAGSCPIGTFTPGVVLTESFGSPPSSFALPTAPGGACAFSVSVDKKYAEITKITLSTVPPNTPCGGSLFYAEGLKAFFGTSCTVVASVTGTVILKTGVDCTAEPATGTPAPGFPSVPGSSPPSAQYACSNGVLSVTGVFLPNVPLTFSVTGPGSFNVLNTLGLTCAGSATTSSANGVSGTPITFCPNGPGSGSISACLTTPLPNNQPQVCSNSISFTFTQNERRVVPYVRWAGEKIALTKCFGPGLAGAPVEFTLQGNDPGLEATLIPTGLSGTLGATGSFPSNSTIFTTTDVNGCATVLGYARGEGVMYVDAAIFSTTAAGVAAGSPIVNEHAFEVFYLKFDHVDLENINPASVYATATALKPYLSFLAGTPAVLGATTFPLSFTLPSAPGANMEVAGATGYSVPLCQIQYVRAMVHGYFEIPGDPSGRPATSVAIPGAPLTNGGSPSAGSYVLPAGRWVLPEDWPVLATFAGFGTAGQPGDFSPSSVLAWDLNSGWVFNPAGENPVFCTGDGTFAAVSPEANAGYGPSFASATGTGTIAPADTDLGPCYSQDGAGQFYSTAPNGPNCVGGETVGIGPFDPTQSCTNPFPLTYTPAGATLIGGLPTPGTFPCVGGVAGPCIVPAGLNSTYLPNGTLNQWDAPMPPAQVSFGITSALNLSFLDEVNKTALYSLTFDEGAPTSAGACNTGYAVNPATGTCQLKVDPDPFYAEAIPASPFIPPIANDAGYLWNSWNFTAGTVSTVRSTSNCFSNAPVGGCVPGQSTSVTVPAASLTGGVCPVTFFTTISGANCTLPGGINVTACTTTGTSDSVVVGDGSGFLPGMSVEVYDAVTGVTVAGSFAATPSVLTITQVIPSPQAGFPNAVELVFAPGALTAAGVCGPAFTDVFIAEQFGLPVTSVAPFQVGETITVGNCGATVPAPAVGCADFPISFIDTTNNILYVTDTATVARDFGPCTGSGSGLSRPGGPSGNPFCEPNLLIPAGTLVQGGPVGAGGLNTTLLGAPPNPYPFWQFIPAAPGANSFPTAGTVYSDNHGEAVVSLDTGVATLVAPVNGACTAPYLPLPINGVVVSCQLPLQTLGSLGFANVAAATKAFSASNPGCVQTFPSGTFVALPNATIGATGPGAGQICINALGGIEFGASATLGSTTVQAVADYPYTRGDHPPISSGPLTKVFTSAFQKSLTVSAGTPGPAGTTSYVVTITAKDVCGLPLFGEPVQVYALGNAGAVVLAPVSAGNIINANTTSSVVTVDPVTGQATLSLEILNSAIGTQGLVVKAVFPFEKVERFVTVIPGTTPGATVNVPYAPGWQMVGGPTGSNFSVAEALFAYDPATGTYTNATASAGQLSSAAPGCTGYWAYFAAPMVISLPVTSHSGDTATCNLAAGWNLVGNPFATPATIQSGVTAYYWNGTSYTTVGSIPVGGSVWIYNSGTTASTVTLTAT